MSAKLLAVVGTDTGVGKTVIGAGLIHGLRSLGLRVAAFKPVETGLPDEPDPEASESADWQVLAQASGQPPESCLGLSYPLPAAPLAAARAARTRVDLAALEQQLSQIRIRNDIVLVEGAGGLCVPFAEGLMWADVLSAWRPDCLVVGRLGLGTVNHTLLTLREIQRRDLFIFGIILNTLTDPGPETPQTPALIEEFGDTPVLGTLPRGPTDREAVAAYLHEAGVLEQLICRYKSG